MLALLPSLQRMFWRFQITLALFSVCAMYILEISDYVGLFSVCVTYIFWRYQITLACLSCL